MLAQHFIKDTYSSVGGLNKQNEDLWLVGGPTDTSWTFRYFGEWSYYKKRIRWQGLLISHQEIFFRVFKARPEQENPFGQRHGFIYSSIGTLLSKAQSCLRQTMVKVSLQLSILHCVARGGEIEVGQNYIELLTLINYLQVFRMAMHVFRFSMFCYRNAL